HVDMLLEHRDARERHVRLPADQPADAAERRVDHRERGTVARAPHRALAAGRHELAVLREQLPVGPEVADRVVDGAAVALVDGDRDVALVLACDRAERGASRPRNVDSLVEPEGVPLAIALTPR